MKAKLSEQEFRIEERIQGLTHLVGNTPLIAIEFEYRGKRRRLFAKAENLNMTESIKDRMALHILKRGYERGHLKPGDRIIEATSGNTGISFAAIGRSLGHPVDIFMPDWMSAERVALIKSLGAKIHPVSKEDGGFVGSIRLADELAEQKKGTFLPKQFSNEDNIDAHVETTGPEIWWQLFFRGLRPDAFIAGVGTGGTIMGAGRYLKSMKPDIAIHPLEPSNSPTLTTGHRVGKHRIQGISDEFIPPIVNLDELDAVVSIDDGDSILMAQKLAAELGIGVGISSGANFLGALKVQEEMGEDAVIATVFPDSNKKYLSTDLLREEPQKGGFFAPDIKLLGFTAYKRVCQTCCDPEECKQVEPFNATGDELPPCPRGQGNKCGD